MNEKGTEMDSQNEKYAIKNLLFTKAIPNYVIPVPYNGHKVYSCTDCGDKFVFESSYTYHISRQSVKITYKCMHCGKLLVFLNRCNLLSHIRSHAFKTATINITDLTIEPLPISYLKNISNIKKTKAADTPTSKKNSNVYCYECKNNITSAGVAYKDRTTHYMQYSKEIHSCPVCLFALPNTCALKTHLRVHLKIPPHHCVECGCQLPKSISYPYNHDCEGFKMMRATARLKCVIEGCSIVHPNSFKDHMKQEHLKRVFKCPFCVVACFNEATMTKHLKEHEGCEAKPLIFYQCQACPGRFVMQNHMNQHLKTHVNTNIVYPCWACGTSFNGVVMLLKHFINDHNVTEVMKTAITAMLNESEEQANLGRPKRIYRVVKRCDQCLRSFAYKCNFDEIGILPNECPYQCIASPGGSALTNTIVNNQDNNAQIICHLCKTKVQQDWEIIKIHYAEYHKTFQCVDVKVNLTRLNISKYLTDNKKRKPKRNCQLVNKTVLKPGKRQRKKVTATPPVAKDLPMEQQKLQDVQIEDTVNEHVCNMCNNNFVNKDLLEEHMISHRDPCMAYQCMECGQSFVVKPSFSTHLLLVHSISDTEQYINTKKCYNENALLKYQDNSAQNIEPLGENQCKICRDQFNDAEELEKHFRVHGMAFLMKNNSIKNH